MPTPIQVKDAPLPPTDGNTKQWDKLKAMRGEHNPPPEPVAAAPEAPEPEKQTPPRDPETGKFVKTEPEPAPAVAAAPAEPTPPPAPTDPTAPVSVEVEIDGQKVQLSPDLATAFQNAEKIKKSSESTTERERLKAELREELKAELAPPAKTPAQLAAEEALARAEAEKTRPKKPDAQLMISNPEEYERQRDAYEEWRTTQAVEEVKRSTRSEQERAAQQQAADTEAQARQILRVQFYEKYPVLKDSADIVDTMLASQFDALLASGVLNKPLSAEDRESLKTREFADVAVKATKRIVKLMSGGKAVVPPPPPPPQLVQSAPSGPQKQKLKEPEKSTDKYPKGSMSAVLAERRARQLSS